MRHVTLAGPAEAELVPALQAHYRQWCRDQYPGGLPGRLGDADLAEAYVGGYHLCLSLLLHLDAPDPVPPAPVPGCLHAVGGPASPPAA